MNPRWCESPGNAARIAALSNDQAPTAITGCPHMPSVETNDFKSESAEFMHQPWRHRASLDANAGIISRMSAHHSGDLFRRRGALAPPQSATGVVDDANGCHLLRNVQTDEVGHHGRTPDGANHRATPPGSRHYRTIRRPPRLPDVHIWHGGPGIKFHCEHPSSLSMPFKGIETA